MRGRTPAGYPRTRQAGRREHHSGPGPLLSLIGTTQPFAAPFRGPDVPLHNAAVVHVMGDTLNEQSIRAWCAAHALVWTWHEAPLRRSMLSMTGIAGFSDEDSWWRELCARAAVDPSACCAARAR